MRVTAPAPRESWPRQPKVPPGRALRAQNSAAWPSPSGHLFPNVGTPKRWGLCGHFDLCPFLDGRDLPGPAPPRPAPPGRPSGPQDNADWPGIDRMSRVPVTQPPSSRGGPPCSHAICKPFGSLTPLQSPHPLPAPAFSNTSPSVPPLTLTPPLASPTVQLPFHPVPPPPPPSATPALCLPRPTLPCPTSSTAWSPLAFYTFPTHLH